MHPRGERAPAHDANGKTSSHHERCDVVVPTFNDGPKLWRAVRSALALRCVARVIIVDDGSQSPVSLSDPGCSVGQDQQHRVILIHQRNGGPSAARNRGLEHVKERWCVFCDADDQLLDGVSDALLFANTNRCAAVVSAREEISEPDADAGKTQGNFKPVPAEWSGKMLPRKGDVFRPIALFGTPGVVIDRSVIDAGVRFDPRISQGQDREFLRRCADVGPIGVQPTAVVLYTLAAGGGNVSGYRKLARRVDDFLLMAKLHYESQDHHHWAANAAWLFNMMSKHATAKSAWDKLARESQARGWKIPLKARLRRWLMRKGTDSNG